MESERDYFERRAAEQRLVAERADDPDVKRRHLELAARLEAWARRQQGPIPSLTLGRARPYVRASLKRGDRSSAG